MAETNNLRIVMFPWLAFGHLIPYLEFAKLIAKQGHHVFFVSTPRNIERLSKIPPRLVPFISFVKLALLPVGDLPDGAEATADVPSHLVKFLKASYDALQNPMDEFLRSCAPDWILHDFASYWLCPIALQLGVKIGYLSTLNPEFHAFMGPISAMKGGENSRKKLEDYTVTPPWIPFPTTVSFPFFEIKKIFNNISQNTAVDNGVSDIHRYAEVIQNSDVIAIRGSYEFESEWFQVLDQIYQKPVFPAGHFPTAEEHDQWEETVTWKFIKAWLDNQNKGSVIYVAFGTEAKPTKSEVMEIAMGLEQSEVAFFWTLKTRRGAADGEAIELPHGFEERVKGRGVVFTDWVPQVKILGHESVGGFLTHCGWSSVVEGIKYEKGLVLLGFFGDQGINARFLGERKIGYPIPREESDGSFTRRSVAEAVRLVMVEEQGRIYRDNVREVKPLFVDEERQDKYVVDFLEYLKMHRNVEINSSVF